MPRCSKQFVQTCMKFSVDISPTCSPAYCEDFDEQKEIQDSIVMVADWWLASFKPLEPPSWKQPTYTMSFAENIGEESKTIGY